jgi:hypothetical protein
MLLVATPDSVIAVMTASAVAKSLKSTGTVAPLTLDQMRLYVGNRRWAWPRQPTASCCGTHHSRAPGRPVQRGDCRSRPGLRQQVVRPELDLQLLDLPELSSRIEGCKGQSVRDGLRTGRPPVRRRDHPLLPRRARTAAMASAYCARESDVNRCALSPAAANSSRPSAAWMPMSLRPTLMALSARGATR